MLSRQKQSKGSKSSTYPLCFTIILGLERWWKLALKAAWFCGSHVVYSSIWGRNMQIKWVACYLCGSSIIGWCYWLEHGKDLCNFSSASMSLPLRIVEFKVFSLIFFPPNCFHALRIPMWPVIAFSHKKPCIKPRKSHAVILLIKWIEDKNKLKRWGGRRARVWCFSVYLLYFLYGIATDQAIKLFHCKHVIWIW